MCSVCNGCQGPKTIPFVLLSDGRIPSAGEQNRPAQPRQWFSCQHAGKLVDRRASETSGARSGLRSSASASSHRRAASILKILQEGPDKGHLTAKARSCCRPSPMLLATAWQCQWCFPRWIPCPCKAHADSLPSSSVPHVLLCMSSCAVDATRADPICRMT